MRDHWMSKLVDYAVPAILLAAATACTMPRGGAIDWAADIAAVIDSEADAYEAWHEAEGTLDEDRVERVALVRMLAGVFSDGQVTAADLGELRALAPHFRVYLEERGLEPQEIETRLQVIRVAVALLGRRLPQG